MELASFTFEFHEHVSPASRKSLLDRLREKDVSLEQLGNNAFRAICITPKAHKWAGYFLVRSGTSNICRITEIAGAAELSKEKYKLTGRLKH